MRKFKISNWKTYTFEFLSIFVAVISAFALNNWNENRRDRIAENKILTEISIGLEKDLEDIKLNAEGHKFGIYACYYFRKTVSQEDVSADSSLYHYFNLTRDFISVQNSAGYETLKSRGLELIQNDSLRQSIISIYEYDYSTLRKFEEEYAEMQFHDSYFSGINEILGPKFQLNSSGNLRDISLPLNLPENEEKLLSMYLWKIEINRSFILQFYAEIEQKIRAVRILIDEELG